MAHDQAIRKHDIIVIGTSAGGVAALETVVGALPKDLAASVFVVMHIPPSRRSALADILSASGGLPVSNPKADQAIEPGRVYVAPADYHLLVEPTQRIGLWHGPKEDNFRPAINPLFRSAAEVYGDRVVGVILTGTLSEGVAGLSWVKRHGGVTVVQDPHDAIFPTMPQNALQHVQVDFIARASDIPKLLVQLANGAKPEGRYIG